jgi:hypothetical protein
LEENVGPEIQPAGASTGHAPATSLEQKDRWKYNNGTTPLPADGKVYIQMGTLKDLSKTALGLRKPGAHLHSFHARLKAFIISYKAVDQIFNHWLREASVPRAGVIPR